MSVRRRNIQARLAREEAFHAGRDEMTVYFNDLSAVLEQLKLEGHQTVPVERLANLLAERKKAHD